MMSDKKVLTVGRIIEGNSYDDTIKLEVSHDFFTQGKCKMNAEVSILSGQSIHAALPPDQSEHTPEPWEVRGRKIVGADGVSVCEMKGLNMIGLNDQERRECFDTIKYNSRRIVACVNSCARIPNEVLESADKDKFIISKYEYAKPKEIEKQRDELMALLKEARDDVAEVFNDMVFHKFNYHTIDYQQDLLNRIDAKIKELPCQ
jgi:hypothetical protein